MEEEPAPSHVVHLARVRRIGEGVACFPAARIVRLDRLRRGRMVAIAPARAELNAGRERRRFEAALVLFAAVVAAHLAEHVVQAVEIAVLGWPRPEARGVLGLIFPWLISSEILHYGYAIAMLIGLVALRPGMRVCAPAATMWSVALWIQVWHHAEHLSLLYQAWSGNFFLAPGAPTSFLQLIPGVQRVELHFAYNVVVAVPMAVAMWCYYRDDVSRRPGGVPSD
jgi:hypothetical protein